MAVRTIVADVVVVVVIEDIDRPCSSQPSLLKQLCREFQTRRERPRESRLEICKTVEPHRRSDGIKKKRFCRSAGPDRTTRVSHVIVLPWQAESKTVWCPSDPRTSDALYLLGMAGREPGPLRPHSHSAHRETELLLSTPSNQQARGDLAWQQAGGAATSTTHGVCAVQSTEWNGRSAPGRDRPTKESWPVSFAPAPDCALLSGGTWSCCPKLDGRLLLECLRARANQLQSDERPAPPCIVGEGSFGFGKPAARDEQDGALHILHLHRPASLPARMHDNTTPLGRLSKSVSQEKR